MLSLCMIVRDSSRTLGSCLDSIVPWVDEMIVVDTGSTDDTRQIASSHGAKVFDFPWCDSFSAARNESLRHAKGDWLFWMDSDDTISPESGEKLRSLTQQSLEKAPTGYTMQVHCPGPPGSGDVTVVDHVKLFRNDPRLRFEGRIHEQILPAIRSLGGQVEWTDIYVTHSGSEHSLEARQRKQQRDLRLLEMELAEKPEHTFVLFNLGMTYADMDEASKALEFLKRSLLSATPDESHVRKAYSLLVSCLVQLYHDEEALRIIYRALEMFRDDAELLFRQGILFQRAQSYERAIESFERAIEDRGERFFASRDRGITSYKARHNLASVYREINRPDLAELQWRLALESFPIYRIAWKGLTDSLIEQKKFTTLAIEIEKMREATSLETEVAYATILRHQANGEMKWAMEVLYEFMQKSPDDIEFLRFSCEFLFNHGGPEDCVSLLEKLCEIAPDDGAAWHNRGSALQRLGRPNEAISYFEKSLAIRPNSTGTSMQFAAAHVSLGNVDAAKIVLQAALESDPYNSDIILALSNLDDNATANGL